MWGVTMRNLSRLVGFLVLGLMSARGAPAHAQDKKIEPARAALKAAPNDPQAALGLARAQRRAGKPADAVATLQTFVLKPSANDATRYELMRAHADLKNHDAAMVACRGVQAQALRFACVGEAFITIGKLGTEAQPQIDKAH
ncbi:MAG: hypothetical protein U0165_15075 [Polyangiaceae bacterium]